MKLKRKRINVNIDNDIYPNDDLFFISQRRYKPTALLRLKIRELRQIEESGADELEKQIEKLRKQRDNLLFFIESKNLNKEYFESLK